MKIHFDMERESLIAEVSKLKNWEKSHIESQTERHLLAETLTNSDTQTEIVHVSEIMTHSETQTGMELLAEVISLTSSASYGSEEVSGTLFTLSIAVLSATNIKYDELT